MKKSKLTKMLNMNDIEVDEREPKKGWHTGFYSCQCSICKEGYWGHKRSYNCADCAHKD